MTFFCPFGLLIILYSWDGEVISDFFFFFAQPCLYGSWILLRKFKDITFKFFRFLDPKQLLSLSATSWIDFFFFNFWFLNYFSGSNHSPARLFALPKGSLIPFSRDRFLTRSGGSADGISSDPCNHWASTGSEVSALNFNSAHLGS